MRRECATPLLGGKWNNLNACITNAITLEPRVLGRVGARSMAGTVNAMAPKSRMQLLSRAPTGPASMLQADMPTNDAFNAMRPNNNHVPKRHEGEFRRFRDMPKKSAVLRTD
eukprot:705788-Pelagomonas_calceolata.AAC.1